MKILQVVAVAALALGLSKLAYANHDGGDGKHCDRNHMWQEADTNKDGVISRVEFMAAQQARAAKMFDRIDTNHDGKIDQAERDAMKAKWKAHHKKHHEHKDAEHDADHK